ncbi:hypothetical protein BwSH20_76750 [Bradyrhizobium ottawaense]|nr:hypothetical protein BwSH20_76750 [Bradyrhizobium ottawaense]
MLAHAGALQQARQQCKNGWRKSAPGRRFSCGKSDFTHGAAKARQRIHHQNDAKALITKIFG